MSKHDRDENFFNHYPQSVVAIVLIFSWLTGCKITAETIGVQELTPLQMLPALPFAVLATAIFICITNDIYCELFKEKKNDD